jgi:DNA-directed RNA polymerase I and III subunit RPAC1
MFDYLENNGDVATQNNTLVFTLDIACTRNAKAPASAADSEKYVNGVVYSRDLKWIPQGKQVPLPPTP